VSEEPGQRVLLDWLNLAAQLREGFSTDLAQDLGVAPFAMKSAGPEPSFEHSALNSQLTQRIFDSGGIKSEAIGDFTLGEWAVRAGKAADEFEHWLRDGINQRCGKPGGQRNSEGVTITGGVFNCNQAAFARNAEFQETTRAEQAVDRVKQRGIHYTAGKFFTGKIAEAEEQVVDTVGRVGAVRLDETLSCFFDLGNGIGIQQFTKIRFSKQLAQLVLVDGEGLGAALGERRIAVIHEIGHVAEEQR
jgi:hypothetical protein